MKNDILLTIVYIAHLNVLEHIEYVNFVSKFAFKNDEEKIIGFDSKKSIEYIEKNFPQKWLKWT